MIKIENIIKSSLVLVVIASILAIVSNFILVPEIKNYYEVNQSLVNEITLIHSNTRLPVAVLGNIRSQVKNEDSSSMSNALKTAFSTNKSIIEENIKKVNVLYDDLEENLNNINRQTFGRHSRNIDEMTKLIDSLKEELVFLDSIISVQDITDVDIDGLSFIYAEKERMISNLLGVEKSLERDMLYDITLIINIIIITLTTLLFLLGVAILRYIKYDFYYMMKSLELVSSKKYDKRYLPKIKPYFHEELKMVNYVDNIIDEKQFSDEINNLLLNYYIVDDLVEALFFKVKERLPIDRLGVAFVDYYEEKIVAEYGVINSGKAILGPGFEVPIESTRLKKLIESGESMIFNDLESAYLERPNSPSLELILDEGMGSNMVIPLMASGSVFGMVFFSSRKKDFFNSETIRFGKGIIDEIETLMNRSYFTKIILSKMSTSFSELVEGKDSSTGEHINRMVKYSVAIGKGLLDENKPGYEITEKDILEIERNAASHDIGKVSIPDSILKKPGPLTTEEWEIMREHPSVGADIFKNIRESLRIFDPDFFKVAEEIARYHHEKWDGSGYPEGLKNHEIPISARIVALADVFDALTSKRVYKEAYAFDKAVDAIQEGAGKHFDPVLVDVFIKRLDEIKKIHLSI